ncbi:MAG: hypothetical protein CL431_00725 [Acidimicrobiaceae bacterium]|nr:hypothetical protein [Acidimicrobiaceae bacterium]
MNVVTIANSVWNKRGRIYREDMSQKQLKISLLIVRSAFLIASVLIWQVSTAYIPAAIGCWFVNRLIMKQVEHRNDDETIIV